MALGEPEILVGIAEIISERTGIATNDVKLSSSLDSLGIDKSPESLVLEDVAGKFRVAVTDDAVVGFSTIGDVVSYVQSELG